MVTDYFKISESCLIFKWVVFSDMLYSNMYKFQEEMKVRIKGMKELTNLHVKMFKINVSEHLKRFFADFHVVPIIR